MGSFLRFFHIFSVNCTIILFCAHFYAFHAHFYVFGDHFYVSCVPFYMLLIE